LQYLDEYPGVPITDGSSLAPSSVHSPFALRRHNPLQVYVMRSCDHIGGHVTTHDIVHPYHVTSQILLFM